MAEKKEYILFQELLRKGIAASGKTQADVASESGISSTYLSRMMNNRFISRPQRMTIQKLAGVLKDVTYADLLDACDYKDEAAILTKDDSMLTEYQKRLKLSMKDRAEMCKKDIMEGFRALTYTSGKHIFPSLDALIQTFKMLYEVEDLTYNILFDTPYNGKGHENAECCVALEAKWESTLLTCSVFFALFYIRTGRGNVMVMDAAFDGASLVEVNAIPVTVTSEFQKYGIETSLLTDVMILKEKSPEEIIMQHKGELLGGILEKGNVIDSVINGFGFYLKETPGKFGEFLEKHKNTFCQSEEEEKMYLDYPEKGSKAFGRCFDPVTQECGIGAAIALIMTRESGIIFTFYEDSENRFHDNPSCVICEDRNINSNEMIDLVYNYAKELGVSHIQECYFRTYIYKDLNSIIKVE